ncbi:MAG: hypothetical protein EKK33_00050 [Bradyrhizobiaceae bacterium]|jgi:hypothetical protein|nr:MAG: hypothetical protein EKK33_00050 [Bradyrhizobiaceae bacterium]
MVNPLLAPDHDRGAAALIREFTGQKSNIAYRAFTPKLLGSIAAERRNLARSLLEWRLHRSRTLGNMD